jgi:hypothetical protein
MGASDETLKSKTGKEVYLAMDKTPVLVTKGLLIGSLMAKRNKDALKEAKITHVLMVRVICFILSMYIFFFLP